MKAEADAILEDGATSERREVQIAEEILAELSASGRQAPETTLANIRKLAQELVQIHRGAYADLSAPRTHWTDNNGEQRHR